MSYFEDNIQDFKLAWWWIWRLGTALLVLFVSGMWSCPNYNVWQQKKDGEAVLSRAQSARMVLVIQAEAEREAAYKRAEAIAIVGKAAKEFPEYRQQEFIAAFGEALHHCNNQVIYVPTERNIPIVMSEKNRPTEEKRKN